MVFKAEIGTVIPLEWQTYGAYMSRADADFAGDKVKLSQGWGREHFDARGGCLRAWWMNVPQHVLNKYVTPEVNEWGEYAP